MGLIAVAAGQLATIVTSLEMTERPGAQPPAKSALRLERWSAPVDLARYRALFRAVGEPWLWVSRLLLDDAALAASLDSPTTELFAVTRRDGTAIGLLELDFSAPGATELVFFGLIASMTGHGTGHWLMAHALRRAWRPETQRVWVHTCDLDHPGALRFYQRHGFQPFARAVETFADPRLTGVHPRDCAPHIVLIEDVGG